jgi:diaminohydroxyphosphoribosylaminopyrimidine deaminase / 5-amino-6-(5-phosphoribosylamino)uracil reductase
VPSWFITRSDAPEERRDALLRAGVDVILIEPGEGDRPQLRPALVELAKRGVTRLLVEGGSQLAAALLSENLIDRIAWFRAARVFGGDGLNASAAFGVETIADAPTFLSQGGIACGIDTLERYARRG